MGSINMNLIKALLLVENSKWRVRALTALIVYFDSHTAVSALPDTLYADFSNNSQFNAALKFLCANNIAVKLNRANAKAVNIPYQKRTWILHPGIISAELTFDFHSEVWKQITNSES